MFTLLMNQIKQILIKNKEYYKFDLIGCTYKDLINFVKIYQQDKKDENKNKSFL